MKSVSGTRWSLFAVLLLLGAVLIPVLRSGSTTPTLTLYCAHDSIFADEIVQRFQDQTGIQVNVRYDEEANKSLGLTNLLLAEKDNPRCDVFWNNQTLGTVRLMQDGVLAPYQGSGFERIPESFKDPLGHWVGFAARLRVYIVNTDQLPVTEEAVTNLLQSESLRNVAIAVPLYGTTLSHYSILAAQLGMDGLQSWHRSLHDRGIREARGNGSVKDLVAEGTCALGFTDTDDVFVAIDQKKPVAMLPIRLETGQSIVIPNSVAMIQGCKHPEQARIFIDFLLSEEIELLLAGSASRQIPLGSVDRSRLTKEVQQLADWAADGVPLEAAAEQNQAVLDWLSAEYLKQ